MEQEKIWDHYQNHEAMDNASFGHAMARYRFFCDQACHCTPIDTGKVLNIGIGSGALETLLTKANREVYCLDPSERAIEGLRQKLGLGERAQSGFIQNIPFADNMFDAVIVSEVLEHLTPEVGAAACREMARVLKPSGRLLGSVPADEALSANECVCPKCGEIFHRWGHVQSFDTETLSELLSQNFQAPSIRRTYFSDSARLNWKGRIVLAFKQLSLRLGSRGSSDTFIFNTQPKR